MTIELRKALAALALPALVVAGQAPAHADVQADFRQSTLTGDEIVDSSHSRGCTVRTNERKHIAILECNRSSGFAQVEYHHTIPEDAYEIQYMIHSGGRSRGGIDTISSTVESPGNVVTEQRLDGRGKVIVKWSQVHYTVNR